MHSMGLVFHHYAYCYFSQDLMSGCSRALDPWTTGKLLDSEHPLPLANIAIS